MSLTMGSGPLVGTRRGSFDDGTRISEHPLYLEELDRRVRGYVGGRLVVDAAAPRLLHQDGQLPRWWFDRSAVDEDLLTPTDRTREDPALGTVRSWDLHVGERTVQDAAEDVPDPAPGLPPLAGLVAVGFDALDRWLEEDDEVIGHPRDPYHRVDTRRSSDTVVVRVGREVVAESTRPVKLFETGLPVRWYLPPEDVRSAFLSPSLTRTICPYKGIASYWSLTVGDRVVPDGAWTYADPLGEALQVRGFLSFLGEGVEVEVRRAA
ncbi:DUF427 domain-containing protein [Geodermatophilus sp. DF01-2]|uniref:DUF427 domain-containing protein n=1 Tax=Geodermatophilus sp. DF01-2 TaxID=2559610 RepID=UPI00107434F9|nr:DUF427 domain-containing protein [Geodermatophilus sp. DF01_2]TFV59556.1 DUF427 domain-containing protein [Geodermatophilus sp. DF01_2]